LTDRPVFRKDCPDGGQTKDREATVRMSLRDITFSGKTVDDIEVKDAIMDQ